MKVMKLQTIAVIKTRLKLSRRITEERQRRQLMMNDDCSTVYRNEYCGDSFYAGNAEDVRLSIVGWFVLLV